jgi:hypothetical protein
MRNEKALYERQWNLFPAIAKLLDDKKLGAHWTGPASTSTNIFSEMTYYFEIYALVCDNMEEIKRAIAGEDRDWEEAISQHRSGTTQLRAEIEKTAGDQERVLVLTEKLQQEVEKINQLRNCREGRESIRANLKQLSSALKYVEKTFAEASRAADKLSGH